MTDVTQYRVLDERIYLSVIKDLWNNGIFIYQLSRHKDNPFVLEMFRRAFEKHKDVTGLIVHSDQGSQYTSHAYHDMLPQVGAVLLPFSTLKPSFSSQWNYPLIAEYM
ncbi:DDE-type integrase/transposase/recombinase [Bacillus sp. FJAT-26390]|uniref:DDE-type integrase/transposase/recombinase n=1 Tax=Bacillus sp. FJAT-26390 TaxID=1743142 RepID=UPI0020FFFCAE|nr:DDE-type integrase/transposase/recombinase [Bacillus sp. FJAT-26390]